MFLITTWLFFMLLCANAINSPITDPSSLITSQQEIIPNGNYQMLTQQTFQLDYDYFPQIYSLQLDEYAIDSNNQLQLLGERTILDFSETLTNINKLEGCSARMREIFYNEWLYNYLPQNRNYVDAIFINDKVFLFTDDLYVDQLNVTVYFDVLTSFDGELGQDGENGQQSIMQSYRTLLPLAASNPKLNANYLQAFSLQNGRVYAVSELGCVSFDASQNINDNQFQFVYESGFHIPSGKIIHTVQAIQSIAVLAVGEDGVMIYQAQTGQPLTRINSLGVSDINGNSGLSLQTIDVREAKWDPTMGYLYILDYMSGLHFFFAQNAQSPQTATPSYFYLNFPKGIAFDSYLKTFIIIFDMGQDKRTYAKEIFVNSVYSKQYYINRYYAEMLTYHDVYMDEFVGVLISDYLQTVFVHTVYKQFQRKELDFSTYFVEAKIHNLHSFSTQRNDATKPETVSTHYLLAVSDNYLTLWRQTVITPRIICNTDQPFQRFYSFSMNASICATQLQQVGVNTDITLQEANLFSVCYIQNNFTMTATSAGTNYTKKVLMWVGIGLGIFAFVLVTAIAGCCLYRRWKRSLEILEKERRISQYEIFSEQAHEKSGDDATNKQGAQLQFVAFADNQDVAQDQQPPNVNPQSPLRI